MQRLALSLALALLAAAPASAAIATAGGTDGGSYAAQSLSEEHEKLFKALRDAKTEAAGRAAENAIWHFWMRSAPSPEIEGQVADAMKARSSYDFAKALEILDGVVSVAPDYAEGWNQRAFILFLQGKFDASLEDIDKALELEPKHFGALAGKANILMLQGRFELGQKALRRAVDIHPWLKERGMLLPTPGKPVIPPGGTDL